MNTNQKFEQFLKSQVLTPYKQAVKAGRIPSPRLEKSRKLHRFSLLKRGRADFDVKEGHITPHMKVLMYCYFYLQMHFESSAKSIATLAEHQSLERVAFFDLGAGPITSGLAFKTLFQETSMDYYSFEHSKAMTDI